MRNDNFIGYVGDAGHPNRSASGHHTLPPSWSENVYFIRSVSDGPIKIGWAANPYRRLADFQMASPVHLMLIAFEEGDQRKEAGYHQRFREHRLHGEWFAPVDEIIQLAARIALPPFPAIKPKPVEKAIPWDGTPPDVRLSQFRPRGSNGRYVPGPQWDGVPIDLPLTLDVISPVPNL